MKITGVQTVQVPAHPNLLFVRLETDEGLTGLGESFYATEPVVTYLHDVAAQILLGRDPLHIEAIARDLQGYVGYNGSGAETRGNSAVDIALWDIFGKAVDKLLYQLLGGPTRDAIRVYNTCAGYRYVQDQAEQSVRNWGLPDGDPNGPYEDLHTAIHHPDQLARSLLDEGVTAMKIWPFDPVAEQSGGHYISSRDLHAAVEPLHKIRSEVGHEIDIMIELHGLWDLPAAKRITAATEEFEPLWLEDPLRADNPGALAELARATSVPIAASETLAGRRAYRDLLAAGGADVVIFDLSWVGGITEAKAIASIADAYGRPVTPHDCTGPVVLTASAHLSVHLPNALIQEFVRAFYSTWYAELVTELPTVVDGSMTPPPGPGLGTELRPEVIQDPGVRVRTSRTMPRPR